MLFYAIDRSRILFHAVDRSGILFHAMDRSRCLFHAINRRSQVRTDRSAVSSSLIAENLDLAPEIGYTLLVFVKKITKISRYIMRH
jgi:hypothetical protein